MLDRSPVTSPGRPALLAVVALGLLAAGGRASAAGDVLQERDAPLAVETVEAAGLEPLDAPRSLGFTDRPAWVRLQARGPGDAGGELVLGWDWPLVDRLDVWWRDGEGAWQHRAGGLEVPLAERGVSHAVQRHVLHLGPGPAAPLDVYVRVATRGPMLLGARFARPDEIIGVAAGALLWFGLWAGALGVLVAAALWRWRAQRERVHVAYALFSAALGAHQAVMSGVLAALAPGLGAAVLALPPVLGAAATLAGLEFFRLYVVPARHHPRLDRLLGLLAWGSPLAALPVLWGGVTLANQLSSGGGSLALGTALVVCALEAAEGNRAARHFLLAFAPLALAGSWYLAMLRGQLSPALSAQVAYQAAFLLTGLAVALALSAQRRDEEARNRSFLEAAVADRSRALDASMARLAAAQRREAVERLAAGVAHDFNNLLTGIEAGVGDLQGEAPSAGPVLQEIRALVRRGGELTRSLLMVARRQPLEPHPVALNGLVGELVRLLERLMKGVAIELDLDGGTGTVLADPGQLEQVVLNLVLNARDACEGRGRIEVATRRVVRAEGEGGRPGGPWVRLTVRDDGPGMDEATRRRVFEPFFTTKPEGKGTGLGLSVVDGVARAHGGFVEVASAPGQGATFVVWLPAEGITHPEGGPALTPPPGGALTATARSVT